MEVFRDHTLQETVRAALATQGSQNRQLALDVSQGGRYVRKHFAVTVPPHCTRRRVGRTPPRDRSRGPSRSSTTSPNSRRWKRCGATSWPMCRTNCARRSPSSAATWRRSWTARWTTARSDGPFRAGHVETQPAAHAAHRGPPFPGAARGPAGQRAAVRASRSAWLPGEGGRTARPAHQREGRGGPLWKSRRIFPGWRPTPTGSTRCSSTSLRMPCATARTAIPPEVRVRAARLTGWRWRGNRRDHGFRQWTGHSALRSAACLRAVLPGPQGPRAGGGGQRRHGSGPEHRQARRAGARRPGAARQPTRARRDVPPAAANHAKRGRRKVEGETCAGTQRKLDGKG